MRKDKFFEAKQEWFALNKRHEANYRAQKALGYVDLEKPRFVGYKKTLVLRADIANRSDSHVFQEIIDRFGGEVHCRKRDFIAYDWTHNRKYELFAKLSNITKKEYDSLIPQIKKWFFQDTSIKNMKFGRYSYYCTIPSFYFDQKIEKRYITKIKVIDSDLIREKDEIEYFMKKKPIFKKVESYWYGNTWTAPKWYRRHLNRIEKFKAKKAIHNFLKGGEYEVSNIFKDFRDASWYW